MKKSLEEFQNEVSQLDERIKSYYKSLPSYSDTRQLITDGVVSPADYYDAPVKIMWLLKEPYCTSNIEGKMGGWSMAKGLYEERSLGKKKDSHQTWHPITYISYGIQNGIDQLEKMPKLSANKGLYLSLRKIAFVNVKKIPGKSWSDDKVIEQACSEQGHIVLEQIEAYQPDIVIGGNTVHLLKNILGVTKEDELGSGDFKKNGCLFINAKHPAQRKKGVTWPIYVNDIIKRTKKV